MNRFDHLSYREIAAIQNLSIKTVETQMGRALKFLRKRLAHLITK
jgi:RNA polymerase sigma-70 factor, ECF subfamily